nr:MAG TPA: hypothetical protein [Caudoviricetes sp.]
MFIGGLKVFFVSATRKTRTNYATVLSVTRGNECKQKITEWSFQERKNGIVRPC